MIKAGQNIIHRSCFNFQYGNKAAATRCNSLIESIFNSHILPELDKAISNTIPENVVIELSKLEINIGAIPEQEISSNLAEKIRESLQVALNQAIRSKAYGRNGNDSLLRQNTLRYLNQSIENFLLNGVLDYQLENSQTIDDLLAKLIGENEKDFLELVRKYANNDVVVKRIAYAFNAKSLALIFKVISPSDSDWIDGFRKILIKLKQENKLSEWSENEFVRRINYFILKYLLNETSLMLNKTRFSENILGKFVGLHTADVNLLIQSAQNYKGANKNTAGLMAEILLRQQEEKNDPTSLTNPKIVVKHILKILNSGQRNDLAPTQQILRAEIVKAIYDTQKRAELIKSLESNGIKNLLSLFYQADEKELHKLILSFASYFESLLPKSKSIKNSSALNELVLTAVLYLNQNLIRTYNKEEFLLLLISASGLDEVKTFENQKFRDWLQTRGDINVKKLYASMEEEKQYLEISSTQKLLFNPNKAGENKPGKANTGEDYTLITKRKIVRYYLDYGCLPTAYPDLNLYDVQTVFIDLILKKDDFLLFSFKTNKNVDDLFPRLSRLIEAGSLSDIYDYLTHFYPEEKGIIENIFLIAEQHLKTNLIAKLKTKVIRVELFLRALAVSKGGSLPGLFMVSALEYLDGHFQQESIDTTTFILLLFSDTEAGTKKSLLQQQYGLILKNSGDQAKKVLQKEVALLLDGWHLKKFDPRYQSENSRTTIRKIAFYATIDKVAFLDVMGQNTADLYQLYTLFRFYLPKTQWQYIEEIMLSYAALRKKLGTVREQAKGVVNQLAGPELDLEALVNQTNKSEELANLFMLIKRDKKLLEKFIQINNGARLPQKIIRGGATTESVLNSLYSFFPNLTRQGYFNETFWKSLVARFAISVFLETKTFNSSSFATAFLNYLLQQLTEINQTETFYSVLNKMSISNSKELRQIVKQWKNFEKSEARKPDEHTNPLSRNDDGAEEQRLSADVKFYFSVLQFYARYGFFPWWGNNMSFPELVAGLKRSSSLQATQLEELLLEAEKEEHIFNQLIRKLPKTVLFEIDQIINDHPTLQLLWSENLRKNNLERNLLHRNYAQEQMQDFLISEVSSAEQFISLLGKDAEQLTRYLYHSSDDKLLTAWLGGKTKIANQISEYLLLSSYFYFRNISPQQWRKIVYKFAFEFYGTNTTALKNTFHLDFFNHLKTHYTSINWAETLKSVYQIIQSGETGGVRFPEALLKLLDFKLPDNKKTDEPMQTTENFQANEEAVTEIMVNNAGLIIFWPFLTRFYEHLSLSQNGSFVDNSSKNRAVYLLQYLAFNAIDFPEYELVLNKLLVGMTAQEHLEPFVNLTDEEMELAQSLWGGLLTNWDKVGNSTPEGVQETFIQRQGILSFEKERVTLTVERKGVDVLLESIPWNISTIKLQWMQHPIYVNWV